MIDRGKPAMVAAVAMLAAGACRVAAQTVGLEETIAPDGTMIPQLTLTADQENAIYNAVISQRVRPRADHVAIAIGAPVPQPVNLPELPVQDNLAFDGASVLKYAMLERDIIVVDPVRMRVVAVIHERAQP